MKTFTLAQRENCGKTPPSAELLKIIEDEDKKPPECDKTFNYGICKIRHAKAVRDYKAAIATGAKRPRKEPCYFCQLITDKITEEAQKAKGENAIEYEEEAEKVPAKVVTQKVTKEIDRESNSLVSLRQEKTDKKEEKKVLKTDKPETKNCAYCGKEFSPISPKNKYCSISCRDKRNNEKRAAEYQKLKKAPVLKKCLYCGKEFSCEISNKVFCCTKCRDTYHNKMRSPAVYKLNETKAVPEIEENQLTKEAPVNSFALKEDKAKVKEPDESIYYVSPKHALTCLSDSLQGFNDVVDLIQYQTDGVISKLAVYLSDDIYETNKRIKSYLDRLEGTSS